GASAGAAPDRLLAARAGRALPSLLQGAPGDPGQPRAHARAPGAVHGGGPRAPQRAGSARGRRAPDHDARGRGGVMPPPRRVARPQPPPSSSRLASLLFVIGCLAVLWVTFALGVAAGRRWPDGFPWLRGTRSAATAAPSTTAPVAATTAPSAATTAPERERRP